MIFRKSKIPTQLRILLLLVLAGIMPYNALSQESLSDLLKIAEKNYPAIAAKQAEAEAQKANISLEKKSLLPTLDIGYDANFATYNNITGMNYPGNNIPISGPPSDDNYGPTIGSGVGLTMRWNPITFGQRKNAIEYEKSNYEKQLAMVDNEILSIQFKVAYLYLEIAGTQELIEAYEKNVDRNSFNLLRARTLIEAGLKPSVDSLQFHAELSKSKTELYQLKRLLNEQNENLKEFLARDNFSKIAFEEKIFSNLPLSPNQDDINLLNNPLIKASISQTNAFEAKLDEVKKDIFPKISIWGTTYARGSGVDFEGNVNHSNGWNMQRYNYGVGLQLSLPLMSLATHKTEKNKQEAYLRSAQSYQRQIENNIAKKASLEAENLQIALDIAQEVPKEFHASESAYKALTIRYEEGLVDYTGLMQSQYELLQSQAKLNNAHLNAWKSLLKIALVEGDLELFLHQIENLP
ncbi:TolC family protein [Aureibacter tunicatorum]|uniref:Outer membrane protein TolC n=1 Tax=Aureibacter tunicatorum TaxID=866807 RepID=A0AAE4BUP9_9BACT|nr:TolC family protein [Aureibacter tunicatorum]MDR6241300.1 outer membrane protein TolC [Aureibacter tunicatorum]BDD03560.1 hypothetical protein AUTU_10430 [Aureibacter tunicatorum]